MRLKDVTISTPWLQRKRVVLQELTLMGQIFYLLGVFRAHRDGDGIGCVMRWWHPITWLYVLVAFPICAVVGEKISDAAPVRLSKHWRDPENRSRLLWL